MQTFHAAAHCDAHAAVGYPRGCDTNSDTPNGDRHS